MFEKKLRWGKVGNKNLLLILITTVTFFAFAIPATATYYKYAPSSQGGDDAWHWTDDPDCWNYPSSYIYLNSCCCCNLNDGCDICYSNPNYCGTNFDGDTTTCQAAGFWYLSTFRFKEGTTNRCCEDSYDNEYKSNCLSGGNIAWSGGTSCLNQMACCGAANKCTFGAVACYTSDYNNGYNYLLTTGNDKYANCFGGYWYDLDDYNWMCTYGIGTTFSYVAGAESAAFGEYPTGTSTQCCGDDDGENRVYERQYPSGNPNGVAWIVANTRCCNSNTDVLNGDEACVPGQSGTYTAILAGPGGAVPMPGLCACPGCAYPGPMRIGLAGRDALGTSPRPVT